MTSLEVADNAARAGFGTTRWLGRLNMEAVQTGVASARWLAAKALSIARGEDRAHVIQDRLTELGVAPSQQQRTLAIVDAVERASSEPTLPVVDREAASLLHEIGTELQQTGTVPVDGIRDRFAEIMAAAEVGSEQTDALLRLGQPQHELAVLGR